MFLCISPYCQFIITTIISAITAVVTTCYFVYTVKIHKVNRKALDLANKDNVDHLKTNLLNERINILSCFDCAFDLQRLCVPFPNLFDDEEPDEDDDNGSRLFENIQEHFRLTKKIDCQLIFLNMQNSFYKLDFIFETKMPESVKKFFNTIDGICEVMIYSREYIPEIKEYFKKLENFENLDEARAYYAELKKETTIIPISPDIKPIRKG